MQYRADSTCIAVCCGALHCVLRCVAVCCSVLQCVAVCVAVNVIELTCNRADFKRVALCCNGIQNWLDMYCSVLQCTLELTSHVLQRVAVYHRADLTCVAVCCNVHYKADWTCVAACCIYYRADLTYVAVCCNVLLKLTCSQLSMLWAGYG